MMKPGGTPCIPAVFSTLHERAPVAMKVRVAARDLRGQGGHGVSVLGWQVRSEAQWHSRRCWYRC